MINITFDCIVIVYICGVVNLALRHCSDSFGCKPLVCFVVSESRVYMRKPLFKQEGILGELITSIACIRAVGIVVTVVLE